MKTILCKYIVTHPGQCHSDDLIAVAIALYAAYGHPEVYRREPTPEELQDPRVLVLDVGGDHNPTLGNFDHHQLPRDAEPACALTFLGRYLEIEEALRGTKWFPTVEIIDSKGPFAWAKANGLEAFPLGLASPLEGALKERFEGYSGETPVDEGFCKELSILGGMIVKYALRLQAQYEHTKATVQVVEVDGIRGLFFPESDITALNRVRDELSSPEDPIAFSVTKDDRGAGLSLYRFNDDTRINFAKLSGNPSISFSHVGGFIAKTKSPLSLDEALALVRLALT